MLTLLLVLGAVTCSPVPSDPPIVPNGGHIEVTHEVRQVTYQVSAEVHEATASSHIPPDVAPEEDPPIPTVTTPHTAPEEKLQDDSIAQEHVPQSEGVSHDESTNLEVFAHEKAESTEKKIKLESVENGEILSKDEVFESTTISEIETSSESFEPVLDSQVHMSSESDSNSQQDKSSIQENDSSMLVVEADASDNLPMQEEATASASPTEVSAEQAEYDVNSEQIVDAEENPILNAGDSTSTIEGDSVIVENESKILTETGSNADPTVLTGADSSSIVEVHTTSIPEIESGNPVPTSHIETEPSLVTSVGLVTSDTEVQETSDITEQRNAPLLDDDDNSSIKEIVQEIPSQTSKDAVFDQEFFETKKRTDSKDLPVQINLSGESSSSESLDEVDMTDAEEAMSEGTRESRVYIDYSDESSNSESNSYEEPIVPEKDENQHGINLKSANSGLESMSMTSPTPESLSEDIPVVDGLEKDEAPPAEHQEKEAAVTDVPKMELQEENSTQSTNIHEPDVIPEVFIHPPSSSVASIANEEFTDNYSDPLEESDNLPDFDVTHEQLPSQGYPFPKEAELIPENSHDHAGELSEGESSDLAAGDHTLEVQANPPRVLLPQQEQISAAAPSSLTPGCIVAIVFGVLVSLVVILGVGGFMIWQRRTQNRPKVLGNDQGYAGSDSGGYIDDQVRVSYVNSQTDTPKGSPEDLISLDNDSFLNSLESMTIQNLWTDNIRHTKL